MDYEAQLGQINETNAFMLHNHIRAVELNAETARAVVMPGPDALNSMGTVHGALMMTLAEVAAGSLARSDGRTYVSVDAGFRLISGGKAGTEIEARAEVVKRGRTLCFIRSRVFQNGKLLLEGDITFYCMGE